METQKQHNLPELPTTAPSLIERLSNSVILKLLVILILLLLMLIPLSWVSDLIAERQAHDESVKSEISSKWGGPQVISGPVIAIPYEYDYIASASAENAERVKQTAEDYLFIVPQSLKVDTDVVPEYLKRGIYQSVVYNSSIKLDGNFAEMDLKKLAGDPARVKWEDAKLFIGMSDTKGLNANPTIKFGEQVLTFETNSTSIDLFERNMVTSIDLSAKSTAMAFSATYELRGSRSLNFFPLADQNHILVQGQWKNPSFNGAYLPESREVKNDSFRAEWSIPSFDRKFPQQWAGDRGRLYQITNNYYVSSELVSNVEAPDSQTKASEMDLVQTNFLEAINNYQQTTRAAKYGILVILLTFASLLFTEIIKKQRIHIIQYVLIGCAMVLFYSLLLAFGEHIVFNLSYLIAAVATIALISSFIYWITRDKRTCLLFNIILAVFYGFIFVLMQLQDFSLLVGTVGMFIILAVMMRLSTKINWTQFDRA